MDNSVNTELIRGHVDTIILRVLQERDRYGYEIINLLSEISDNRYAIKQPTLYSCLKRLEKLGFISSYFGDESNGGRRRYYKLTDKGSRTLNQDQREWEYSRTILDKLLSDKQVDLKTVDAPFDATDLRPITKRVKAYDPSPAERLYATTTQPIVIPITVEAKTIQVPSEPPKPTSPTPEITQKDAKADTKVDTATPSAQQQLADQQRHEASKLLQIGDYAIPAKVLIEQQITPKKPDPKEELKPQPKEYTPDYTAANNYKDVLGALFAREPSTATASATAVPIAPKAIEKSDEPTLSRQFYDLEQSLSAEGYKLKSYSKTNAAEQYYLKYIYSNRLARDTSFLLYLTIIIELIIIYIGRNIFGYSLSALIAIGGGALVVPAAAAIIWALNPTKRVKARFSLSSALINSIIAYILIVALSTIIHLVSPSIDVGLDDGKMYVPFILAANLPLYTIIYDFLYKSKHYHIK